MSLNNKIKELIDSLINLTRSKKLEWNPVTEYLEENRNEMLRHFVINNHHYYNIDNIIYPYLNEYRSYCSSFMDGFIYCFSYENVKYKKEYYILCTQNKKSSEIISLNSRETHQEDLSILITYIKNQIDNIDIFVESIISEGKKSR